MSLRARRASSSLAEHYWLEACRRARLLSDPAFNKTRQPAARENAIAVRKISPHNAHVSLPKISEPALEEAPATSFRRAVPLAIVLAGGIVFSGIAALVVRQQERQRFEVAFDRQTQIQLRAMQVAIREYGECLYTLRDLFNSSEEVLAPEFRRTAADLRIRHPGLEVLGWLKRVKKDERAKFEAAANREDGVKFPIQDSTAEGGGDAPPPDPAPEREEYLPLQYCDPVSGNEKMFGFDHLHGPYRETIDRAVESGAPQATQRVTLGEGAGAEPGWAFALAAYVGDSEPRNAADRASRLRGILAGAVPFRALLKDTVIEMPSNPVSLLLLDESAEGGAQYLAHLRAGKIENGPPPLEEAIRAGLHRAIEFPVAGRRWLALFQPMGQPASGYPAAFLGCGICLTALLARLLHSAQRNTLTVQRLVGERTKELHEAQRALHEDNERHKKSEERYRTFVEQSHEAIWRFELSEPIPVDLPEQKQAELYYERATLGEANDIFARMYGYERSKEMYGMPLSELMPRDATTFEHLRQYVRNGYRMADAESHEVGRDGTRRIFLNNLTGIIENGRLVRVWGTQIDVTDQRSAEEDRRRAEVRLRSALSAASLGTWEWDVEADTIIWSEATERMFGFAPGGFRGGLAAYLELIHPDHRALDVAGAAPGRWSGQIGRASCRERV